MTALTDKLREKLVPTPINEVLIECAFAIQFIAEQEETDFCSCGLAYELIVRSRGTIAALERAVSEVNGSSRAIEESK